MTRLTAAIVKDAARQAGADLVGIASIDRFAEVEQERNPKSIFPECQSVVVLARRVLRGAMRGVEEGTNFSSTYGCFGYRWLEDNFLAQTTYDVTCLMEAHFAEAVPLFGYFEEGMPKGMAVAPDKPAPNVYINVHLAAQAAGLGEIGLGDFFITPQYGIRQRLAMILTDAALQPDPIMDRRICGDCEACASACPFGAIDVESTTPAGLPGHQTRVARIDYEVCKRCPNGALLAKGRGVRPDRIAAACGRACVVQLEQAGKCENRFVNQFRKRAPWAVDLFRRPIVTADDAMRAKDIGCGRKTDAIGQGEV